MQEVQKKQRAYRADDMFSTKPSKL